MSSTRQPWFLSITAKWSHAEHFDGLETCLGGLGYQLPYYHLPIPPVSWHSTLFALAKLTDFPSGKIAALHAEELLHECLAIPGLASNLQSAYEPFTVQPAKLRCFDDGTTVQFAESDQVSSLRDRFRELFLGPFQSIARDRAGIESLLQDPNKSRGGKFFGSIARSAHPVEAPDAKRWEIVLPAITPLTFRRVYFLVSDDALTNRHTSDNCVTIGA